MPMQGPQFNAPSASQGSSLYAAREIEKLRYQSVQFDLSLTDNRGRSVDLSFSSEQLSYSRSYDQFGTVSMVGGIGNGNSIADAARGFTLGAIGEQHAAVYQHESIAIDYSAMTLEVEGDMDLLQDYFASDATAQRIFDFVTGLNPGLEASTEAFTDFARDIQQGIADGFAQAEHLLGMLPDISQETQALLDMMLAEFTEDPKNVSSASSLLAAMREEETDAHS